MPEAGSVADAMQTDSVERQAGKERIVGALERAAMPRKADASEVAKVIAFLLSDEASFVTGSVGSERRKCYTRRVLC